jgi:hypothetical protein
MLSVEMGLRELASLKVFFFSITIIGFKAVFTFLLFAISYVIFPEMYSVKIRYMSCALRVVPYLTWTLRLFFIFLVIIRFTRVFFSSQSIIFAKKERK